MFVRTSALIADPINSSKPQHWNIQTSPPVGATHIITSMYGLAVVPPFTAFKQRTVVTELNISIVQRDLQRQQYWPYIERVYAAPSTFQTELFRRLVQAVDVVGQADSAIDWTKLEETAGLFVHSPLERYSGTVGANPPWVDRGLTTNVDATSVVTVVMTDTTDLVFEDDEVFHVPMRPNESRTVNHRDGTTVTFTCKSHLISDKRFTITHMSPASSISVLAHSDPSSPRYHAESNPTGYLYTHDILLIDDHAYVLGSVTHLPLGTIPLKPGGRVEGEAEQNTALWVFLCLGSAVLWLYVVWVWVKW